MTNPSRDLSKPVEYRRVYPIVSRVRDRQAFLSCSPSFARGLNLRVGKRTESQNSCARQNASAQYSVLRTFFCGETKTEMDTTNKCGGI